MDFESRIKNEAGRLGFTLVGITSPEPPPHFSFYQSWIAAGRHAGMDYLATDRALARRQDPRLILPDCRSILVLGVPYAPPGAQTANPAGPAFSGQIAAYAQGEDYHEVLKPRLKALVAFIEAGAGHPVPNRWYTDTGPVLERDLAQRAGLGWIGKNTCLIHPKLGSYFILAEILLALDLEPDAPFETDHCGSCARCIDACPTQCILPDRTLDSAHCISYLTIENKGPLPPELRPELGDWVFGCDICQQVCPWNIRFAVQSGDAALSSQHGTVVKDLLDELSLSPEAFNRKFKTSPVKRAKRRGYLRNVAVAIGNKADPAGVPALTAALQDHEPLVRVHAAWALGRIGGEDAARSLHAAEVTEMETDVRQEIRSALRRMV